MGRRDRNGRLVEVDVPAARERCSRARYDVFGLALSLVRDPPWPLSVPTLRSRRGVSLDRNDPPATHSPAIVDITDTMNNAACSIRHSNLTFTRSLNQAAENTTVENGKLTLRS